MRQVRIAAAVALVALAAACGGRGTEETATRAAADSPAVQKAWTPDQARALRKARARADSAAPIVVLAPSAATAAADDSAHWAAEEKTKYDSRVRAMESYAGCMARTRGIATAEIRAQLEAACAHLPRAPH